MARAEAMRRELMAIFQTELDEHLSRLSQEALALEHLSVHCRPRWSSG